MPPHRYLGRPVPRREDHRFLVGAGRFTDDLVLDGQAHAAALRSPHPHARIRAIETAAALAMPGVLAVLTAADIAAEIPRPIPTLLDDPAFRVRNRDGGSPFDAAQYPLARGKVRFVGEPVAFVVAETRDQACDAAEQVAVDYEPLAPVMTFGAALAEDAPRVWDELPRNRSLDWEHGDAEAVDRALAAAAHVVHLDTDNNRVAVAFMEPRACIGEHDPRTGRYTLWAGSQTAHRLRDVLSGMLAIDPGRLRVVSPDTGGGFGARGAVYPEFALALVAARRLGRPVKWTAERAESFLSDTQARDQRLIGDLAVDAEGHFTALRMTVDWRHGAYVPGRSLWVLTRFLPPTVGGVYTIPVAHLHMRGAFTNTTPQTAYRGVGRMEATYLIESLVDAAARATGIDRIELRRRNLVGPERMPWTAAGGAVYTSGDFVHNLDRALALADWNGFAQRRAGPATDGRVRGIGLAMYVENDGGAPSEYAEVEALPDGAVIVASGTQNFGMGHETLFAQIAADELGIEIDRVQLVQGDTDRVPRGTGSHGSRSARVGGTAVIRAIGELVERGRALAGELFQASAAQMEYDEGRYRLAGSARSVTLAEVAHAAAERGERLAGSVMHVAELEAHSNGCHVCEIEIDPATGGVRLLRHTMVTDVGRALNPLIVEGQLHGGAAQGLGQALLERVVYDDASGQMLTGTFADYAIPRADDVPRFASELNEIAESDNPLGVKGAGEGATTAAPAALMNAVRDALAGAGLAAPEMPVTPERVWRMLARSR